MPWQTCELVFRVFDCGTESRAGTPLSLLVASGRPFARSGRAIRAAAQLVFETVQSWGGPSPRPVVGPQVCSISVVAGPNIIALARHASALPEKSLLPCSQPQALPLCRRWCPTVAHGSPDLPDPAWAGAEPMDGVTGRRHSPPGRAPPPAPAVARCRVAPHTRAGGQRLAWRLPHHGIATSEAISARGMPRAARAAFYAAAPPLARRGVRCSGMPWPTWPLVYLCCMLSVEMRVTLCTVLVAPRVFALALAPGITTHPLIGAHCVPCPCAWMAHRHMYHRLDWRTVRWCGSVVAFIPHRSAHLGI